LLFVEAERSIVRNEAGKQQADAVSAHQHGLWRKLDDNLLPTDGYALALQTGAGQARESGGGSGPFARLYGRLTAYKPFGKWYGQARLELGQVFKRDDLRVPESQLFRAGGDESVRGYAYRELAPTVNGVVTSGSVLFTASAEIARPILESLPAVWGAAFVDAGNSALRWNDLDPAVGYGVGVRWRSPIGPIKIDVAYGHEVHRFRLHLSVGVVLTR
jgi:translocation and assembly module TamA